MIQAVVPFSSRTIEYSYGNLESLYPTYSYSKLKALRLKNWNLFKARCDNAKTYGGTVRIKGERLEMFVPSGESITITESTDSLTVEGVSKTLTQLYFYPLTPTKDLTQNVFDIQYGTNFTLRNISIARDDIKRYETYSCVLKKNGNVRLIELLGDIRNGFWDDLTIGDTIVFAWELEVQGQTMTVADFDSVAKTITVSSDISSLVTNDQSGYYVNAGFYFREDIPLSEYTQYGQGWYINEGMIFVSQSYVWTDESDAIITLDNVNFDGAEYNVFISSGACKLYATDVYFTGCQLGVAFFGRDIGNNQQFHINNVTFEDCGYYVAGGTYAITADNKLGGGAYVHPNVSCKKIGDGNLYLQNNIAAAFRQYSSTGEKTIAPGSTTQFGKVYCLNNTEYDFATSNSMPVTIDYIESPGSFYSGGFLDINGGYLTTFSQSNQIKPSEEVTDIAVNITDCTIKGTQTFGWLSPQNENCTITYTNCTFETGTLTNLGQLMMSETSRGKLGQLNIIGGSMVKGPNGGTYYTPFGSVNGLVLNSRMLRRGGFRNVLFQDFTTEYLFGGFFTSNSEAINPANADIYTFIDCSINTHLLVQPNAIQNNKSYTYVGTRSSFARSGYPAFLFNNLLKPKTGTTSKSIISGSYAKPDTSGVQSLTNVLELDYNYNQYNVNAGTIKVVGPIQNQQISATLEKAIASNAIDGDIIVNAIGGDVVFSAFNPTTNPNSNIKNDYTCLSGQGCKLTPDTKDVLATGANSSTSTVIGTGNGITKIFSGSLGFFPKVVGTVSVTVDAITGTADSDGIITGTGIVAGQVDLFGMSYYLEFTNAPSGDITIFYDIYNGHKFTGSFTVTAYP